ncbi:hypothetical protein [Microbacterium sp. 22242]|uniref:hypothetical protein n=1 Tax=Microbacterium sp. 22242 TaxID=3453896 RepID=UPI003F87898B
MDREKLTISAVAAYLGAHPMTTANWFGPTGRTESSTWIAEDGTGWRVWDTDEKGVEMDDMTLRTESESEALEAFLARAEWHRRAAASAVNPNPPGQAAGRV